MTRTAHPAWPDGVGWPSVGRTVVLSFLLVCVVLLVQAEPTWHVGPRRNAAGGVPAWTAAGVVASETSGAAGVDVVRPDAPHVPPRAHVLPERPHTSCATTSPAACRPMINVVRVHPRFYRSRRAQR